MRLVKITERLLGAIPLIIGVAIIVFLFMRMTPGDPVDIMMGQSGAVSAGEVERLRSEFNLDKPLPEQLWLFLAAPPNVIAKRGDNSAHITVLTRS